MADDTTTDQPTLDAAEEAALREATERAQTRLADDPHPEPAQPEPVRAELLPARTRPAPLAEPALATVNLTDAQKELIAQLNPDATKGELEVFFYQAARTGLDPVARQIYLVKRKGKMTIQTGIDGYRLVAARTGLMAGSDDPVFSDPVEDGRCRGGTRPTAATVTVWRIAQDGRRYPYTATARWDEYAPDLDADAAFAWREMPYLMLAKCAEALALRKAFPAELSGVYTDVEMAAVRTLGAEQPDAPLLPDHVVCPSCGGRIADHSADPDRGNRPLYRCTNRDCQGGGRRKDGPGRYPWGTYREADLPHGPAAASGDDTADLPVYDRIAEAVCRFTGGDLDAAHRIIDEEAADLGIDPATASGAKANRLMVAAVKKARLAGFVDPAHR